MKNKVFQERLLRWFDRNKRSLPWRLNGNPYRIFVVEVMLQQTQIKTVLPYYDRWLKAFPNIKSLAHASLDKVLKLWEGLGYYSRARNLHKAANMIVSDFGGVVPREPRALQSLPGVGRYTAGAISSIAYQNPVPLVDGNVTRVLSRVFNLKKDVSKPETFEILYEIAGRLVSQKRPGDFNQALMELGALVCIPEWPQCDKCPVAALCRAKQQGDPSQLPIRSKGVKVRKMEMVVGILKQNGKLLIRRRKNSGIWGGLWEVPSTIRFPRASREDSLKDEFSNSFGMHVKIRGKMKPIQHRFTHREVLIHPYELTAQKKITIRNGSTKWVDEQKIKRFSFSVPHQKILKQYVLYTHRLHKV
jgi:A/G-specific adenine glycosylase